MTRAARSCASPSDRQLRPASLPLALAVLALSCADARADAATTTTNLSVGATVLPSCLVSTASPAGTSGSATSECDNFGDGSVAISRESSSKPTPPGQERDSRLSPGVTTGGQGTTYVTITY